MKIALVPPRRIKFNITILVVTLFALCLSCVRPHPNPLVTPENYQKLIKGMAREEVVRILGEPDSRLVSRPCKCADIETLSYLSGKIGIDVKIFNGKLCEKNMVDFKKFEMHE